ncbi:Zinc finger, BED-type predicted [Ceratobasidium sp. AG-Ba]|nr:Zinc finger, BED-type predicted [Ceratobasidium sp. AG-Ba]
MSGSSVPKPSFYGALERLKEAVANLPSSAPKGTAEGAVWRHFSIRPKDIKGPLFKKINQSLTECFLGDRDSGLDNIRVGSFGMDVVVRFLDEYAKFPKISSSDLYVIELKIGQLTDLVNARINSLAPDKTSRHKRKRTSQRGPKTKRKRRCPKTQAKASSDDSDFCPPSRLSSTDTLEKERFSSSPPNSYSAVVSPTDAVKVYSDGSVLLQTTHAADSVVNESKESAQYIGNNSSGYHSSNKNSDMRPKKPGPKGSVRQWALSHFSIPSIGRRPDPHNPPTTKPVWVFKCKYCDSIRTVNRSEGCEDFVLEQGCFSASNLAYHLRDCANAPDEVKKDPLSKRPCKATEVLTSAQESISEMFRPVTASTPANSGPSSLSKSRFRSALIQGVVRDNYPLTFGEGAGMRQVFRLLGIELPSHQTLREDLHKLYRIIYDTRVTRLLNTHTGRFAISSDAWTSRSFVFSLGGLVVTYIDDKWNLQEILLDVVDLNADHEGKKIGRRIFKSLTRAGIAGKIIASMTDNASNNQTMNAEISMRVSQKFGITLNATGMSVTCLCHALHLICSAMLASIKAVEPVETDEAYAYIKSFESDEIFEESAEVLEEECRIRGELSDDSDDESSDSDGDEAILANETIKVQASKNASKHLNPVQKAFNQYVATLDDGKSSREQGHARALKRIMCMTDEEWDAIDEILRVLECFDLATHDFSNRGRTTLHSVLPTYAYLKRIISESRSRLNHLRGAESDVFGLLDALAAGEDKLTKYFDMARQNDLIILASVLHPGMRTVFFEDTEKWGNADLATRGQALLEYMYDAYKDDSEIQAKSQNTSSGSTTSTQPKGFIDSLLDASACQRQAIMHEELLDFLRGKYPYDGGDVLVWWKKHEVYFPVLSKVARDILAIPATSVSVERIFSRCRLVMSEYRHRMSVQTAREIVTCNSWLQAGLGAHLPEFVTSSNH